jgi:hypothetical protein
MVAEVFVFGSNLSGRHGRGSALAAKHKYGAIQGRSVGRQGNAYAIPTKGHMLEVLPLDEIRKYVREFIDYAEQNWTDTFIVVEIGCGLAGFDPWQIGPMFKGAPKHVKLPPRFEEYR